MSPVGLQSPSCVWLMCCNELYNELTAEREGLETPGGPRNFWDRISPERGNRLLNIPSISPSSGKPQCCELRAASCELRDPGPRGQRVQAVESLKSAQTADTGSISTLSILGRLHRSPLPFSTLRVLSPFSVSIHPSHSLHISDILRFPKPSKFIIIYNLLIYILLLKLEIDRHNATKTNNRS